MKFYCANCAVKALLKSANLKGKLCPYMRKWVLSAMRVITSLTGKIIFLPPLQPSTSRNAASVWVTAQNKTILLKDFKYHQRTEDYQKNAGKHANFKNWVLLSSNLKERIESVAWMNKHEAELNVRKIFNEAKDLMPYFTALI